MASLNRQQIIGRLGGLPNMRFTPSGKPVTDFSVAVDSYRGSGDDRKKITEWFKVVCWDRQAESCNQYLLKGSLVYAEGEVHLEKWEKDDGKEHSRLKLDASRVVFLDKKGTASEDELPNEG
ncbi:MAG: single-stranded DNA-binding protein [Dehalococcoidia bacterium]|jgi:single-strand DNA-binding protein